MNRWFYYLLRLGGDFLTGIWKFYLSICNILTPSRTVSGKPLFMSQHPRTFFLSAAPQTQEKTNFVWEIFSKLLRGTLMCRGIPFAQLYLGGCKIADLKTRECFKIFRIPKSTGKTKVQPNKFNSSRFYFLV